MAKFSDFKIGDDVIARRTGYPDKISKVGCIHPEIRLIYLKSSGFFPSGARCEKHGTRWLCREKFNGDMGGSADVGELIKSQPSKTIMTSVLEFFRNVTLSAEDMLLKKYGMEDPINVPTEEGMKLAKAIMYKNLRPEIINLVKAMDIEAKKEEKK